MKYLRPIIDLVLYGNFWIAACAIAMTLQTQIVLSGHIYWTPFVGLVGFSTLMIYAIHRYIGLRKVRIFTDTGRYSIIEKFKKHILFYATIGGIGAISCFFFLSLKMQVALVLPGLISLGYVIPILGGKKRLRDLNYLKIYLIAIVWAWITVILPILDAGRLETDIEITLLLFFERMLFVFAITLPFDIRDLKVDGHTGVETIPLQIGIGRTKKLASIVLFIVLLIAAINLLLGYYTMPVFVTMAISCATTNRLIQKCDSLKNDYYFSGLIDGTMIFQFLLIFVATFVVAYFEIY
jgi:4-hydroxybenzoate polyprenyltransferase